MQRISPFVAPLLLVVALAVFVPAQTNELSRASQQPHPVVASLKQFLANAADPATHEKFWADDLVYVTSTGRLRTKPEVVSSVRAEAEKPASPTISFAAEDIQVREFGSIALVNFTLMAHEGPPVGPGHEGQVLRYRTCGVFRHNKEGWQVISWQSTLAPEPPKPLK